MPSTTTHRRRRRPNAATAMLAAVALRIVLLAAWRAPRLLAWRPEVSTLANSVLDWRECARLMRLGADPYFSGGGGGAAAGGAAGVSSATGGCGAACHTPPLLVAALSPLAAAAGGGATAAGDFLAGLPNVALDCLAAWCVSGMARWVVAAAGARPRGPRQWRRGGKWRQGGQGRAAAAPLPEPDGPRRLASWFLWNPCALLACVSASTTPWENAAALAAVLGAAARSPGLAGGAAAAATYLSGPTAALLLVPLGLLIWKGPEAGLEVVGGEGGGGDEDDGGEQGGRRRAASKREDGDTLPSTPAAETAARGLRQRRRGPAIATAEQYGSSSDSEGGDAAAKQQQRRRPQQQQHKAAAASCGGNNPQLLLRWMFLHFALWLLALFVLSDLSLRAHPQAQVLLPPLRRLVAAATGAGPPPAALSSSSSSSSSSWLSATWGFRLGATGVDLTPNLGLHWYLQAEAFEPFAAFFRFLLVSHAALLALPLAARFPTRPLLLLVLQLAAAAAFRPYPSAGDLATWTALAPLLAPQLRRFRAGLFASASAALLAALAPAMWRQWVDLDAGNPNFFYSITLLHAGWQVLALVQLVLLTAAVEEDEEEDGEGEEQGQQL